MSTLKEQGITDCSICQQPFNNNEQFGNNAEPINNGRCCDICNRQIVIPKRLDMCNLKVKQKKVL